MSYLIIYSGTVLDYIVTHSSTSYFFFKSTLLSELTVKSETMGPLMAAFEDRLSLYVILAAHAEISKYLQ